MKVLHLILISVFLVPTKAFAIEMEYFTYNGFDSIDTALTMIALIFSDVRYGYALAAVVLASWSFEMFSGAVSGLVNGKGGSSGIKPLLPVIGGFIVYSGLVVPKGEIILNDQVQTKPGE